ncbi:type II toxin-antitoxin system PemK/MazF family toxin [Arthrobacter gengyunqii]|uniref:Type II toxin-antitoxin system PemK/MazF family toxin n=1 Tax=Arthrobacter gengyunqii TaxID=2886940 RepID=A0A9X1S7I9_9MICC|nr:type II toxin-antitoxin system PemK/MazF family toxin [Arthrobacter gengyunqii]MCC3265130.1 type II toxin-antitoxin system PemK/MazF family toxin [Arthrobacter gengyunqii]MCC3269174.1 type II toxin-antitoxin system PemK/MazF family toxin [Arthrobacter gengyunqii]UOY94867.1 type II toxin-antitoxin system PemK/MazF family toxin [Arthrobacter gengyunqii]
MSFSNRSLLSLARTAIRLLTRPSAAESPARKSSPASSARKPAAPGAYPGDYRGKVTPVYAPSPDGSPDPGEVVWAWVPYEDDYSQGKDRPVLLIGRSGSRLLALMMTSRDRNNGRESDPDYVDVGTGPWDSQGRPSEVKLDRVLQLDPATVRRQGAVMPPAAFQRVATRFSARN